MECSPRGNPNATYMIVGEAPGKREEEAGLPFVGPSGMLLDQLLNEAGIDPEDCFFTNVARVRPPNNAIEAFLPGSKKAAEDRGAIYYRGRWVTSEIIEGLTRLEAEINSVKPNVIIAFGATPLWALCGEWGIQKWRGSVLQGQIDSARAKVIPTYHPAYVMRVFSTRATVVRDLKRAKDESAYPEIRIPPYDFLIRPSYEEVLLWLQDYIDNPPADLAVDIETKRHKYISCVGFAHSEHKAICIPFLCTEGEYWSEAEELNIVEMIRVVLSHPKINIIGQNYVYDQQYFARLWGIKSNHNDDTLIAQHCCFPGTPKGLDYISSMYCDFHRYWKDEGKEVLSKQGDEENWIYNCKDCVTTYESMQVLRTVLEAFGLTEQYALQMQDARNAFRIMLRGVLVDRKVKVEISMALMEAIVQRQDALEYILGYNFNPNSPPQVQKLIYDVLGLPKQYNTKKTPEGKRRYLTTDAKALNKIYTKCPIEFRPLLDLINDIRSLKTIKSTFADSRVDKDNRFRCSVSVAHPETFRWATSQDAFGYGTNMQNIPSNKDD